MATNEIYETGFDEASGKHLWVTRRPVGRRQLSRLCRERACEVAILSQGCGELARLVAALDLARDGREQASSLFRTAQNEDLLKGRSIETIAGGCVMRSVAVLASRGIRGKLQRLHSVLGMGCACAGGSWHRDAGTAVRGLFGRSVAGVGFEEEPVR